RQPSRPPLVRLRPPHHNPQPEAHCAFTSSIPLRASSAVYRISRSSWASHPPTAFEGSMTDKTPHPPYPEAFAALGVRPSILRALAQENFTTPSEIQNLLIPKALAGVDLLGQARTGTGKTAAFAIPILQRCDRDGATQAIILVPTRELAVQVDAEIKRIGKFTPIRSVPVYGGQKISAQ